LRIDNHSKLLAYSLIIGLFNALFPVFVKLGRGELQLFEFTLIWYFIAVVFYAFYIIVNPYIRKNIKNEIIVGLKLWRSFLLYLILNSIAIILLYHSLQFLQTNTFTFLLGTGILFNMVISVIFLKEIANLHLTLFSVLIIVTGFTLIRYSLNNIEVKGLGFLILSTALFAVTNFIVKTKLKSKINKVKISNVLIGGTKALFIFICSAIILFGQGDFVLPTSGDYLYLFLGAFVGPFAGYILVLKILREFGLNSMVIYKSSEYSFAAILGIIVFNQYLSIIQLGGVILILLGIIIYNKYQTIYYS